jgi:sn-glycerol 3-phosphate transport system substrate-binding protein
MDEELEAVWAGKKTPKDALDAIVKRGNELPAAVRAHQQVGRA